MATEPTGLLSNFGLSGTERVRVDTALVFALIAIWASGCSLQRMVLNTPIAPEDVEFVVLDQTTMSDVVTRIGAPDAVSKLGEKFLFRYDFSSQKSVRVDFGWIARFWSPVSPPLNMGWSQAGVDVFLVAFNRDFIATDFAFGRLDKAKAVSFWPTRLLD